MQSNIIRPKIILLSIKQRCITIEQHYNITHQHNKIENNIITLNIIHQNTKQYCYILNNFATFGILQTNTTRHQIMLRRTNNSVKQHDITQYTFIT